MEIDASDRSRYPTTDVQCLRLKPKPVKDPNPFKSTVFPVPQIVPNNLIQKLNRKPDQRQRRGNRTFCRMKKLGDPDAIQLINESFGRSPTAATRCSLLFLPPR